MASIKETDPPLRGPAPKSIAIDERHATKAKRLFFAVRHPLLWFVRYPLCLPPTLDRLAIWIAVRIRRRDRL
jgi:hypothetical protein